MPKHEILHIAGMPVGEHLKDVLANFFSAEDIMRLERFGGKVTFSITAPYQDRKKGGDSSIIIDAGFIESLKELRGQPKVIKGKLIKLPMKKLKELAKIIEHPVRTKSTRQEVVEEIVAHFHSDELWRKISGRDEV